MKQVLYVSTAVLAFAFIFAFYYYLTVGEQTVQTSHLATISKPSVEQPYDCRNLSFLNRHLFGVPSVKPPVRATDWPLVVQSPYLVLDEGKPYSAISQKSTERQAMALNADNTQVQKDRKW